MMYRDKEFVVVLRGPSAVLFAPSSSLRVQSFPSAIGPVDVTYTTRYLYKGAELTVPGHLWIEVRGKASTLEEALVPFANAGFSLLPLLSLSTNAAIGETDIELGFELTPGVSERQYFQSYIPPETDIIHNGRLINIPATVTLLEVLSDHTDSERLRRGANQYRLALQEWRLGRESLSLAHLWMAIEAITKAKVRSECAVRGITSQVELAQQLGVELKQLDGYIRKESLLKGDKECYDKAKEASDGFEHGFLGYDKIRELATGVRQRMAQYVRGAILELCGLHSDAFTVLTSNSFEKPMGYWPIVKYIRGKLIGKGDELAAPGNAYPLLKWSQIVKSFDIGSDGKINYEIDEKMTVETAEGIGFQQLSFEAWQAG